MRTYKITVEVLEDSESVANSVYEELCKFMLLSRVTSCQGWIVSRPQESELEK